jgi:hypothetical protein
MRPTVPYFGRPLDVSFPLEFPAMKFRILAVVASVAILAAWTSPSAAPYRSGTYSAHMNASNATPPTEENGTGLASMRVEGNKFTYTITVSDLSGPATAAHIHVGADGVSGPPVLTFEIKNGGKGRIAEGSVDLSKNVSNSVSGDSLRVLLGNGSAYVNVHTAKHPGGEIRAQIVQE